MSGVVVTGGTGFVGSALVRDLLEGQHDVTMLARRDIALPGIRTHRIDDLSQVAVEQLQGNEAVVHLAARVHVMRETSPAQARQEFHRVNVETTRQLALQAANAGVKRFIFISSIKVNGEATELGRPYSADDQPAPVDPYGESKREAEDTLRRLAAETGLEVVIIRPPLVYGPGVKANFRSMMGWLKKGVPLPLGAIHNKRSLVALDNLIDLIITCIDHPAAAKQTLLVSDDEDLSTTELLRRMSQALEKPARLLPVPAFALEAGAALLGRRAIAQRLCGSLQVDISKTREVLGWSPPVTVDAALRITAEAFQKNGV